MRLKFLALLLVALALVSYVVIARISDRPGCTAFLETDEMLIAHGGGGNRDEILGNRIATMDRAYAAGFRLIEIDFRQIGPFVLTGHDWADIVTLNTDTSDSVLRWLAVHPDAYLITDFKTDNLSGLRALGAHDRIIPQIYNPAEYEPVRQMGFENIIFTAYRTTDRDWVHFVEQADLWAVTVPVASFGSIEIDKPVFVHTVNAMPTIGADGYYTDCLRPAGGG